MSRRSDEERQFFYEGIAHQYDRVMNRYDLDRRLQIVFEELCRPGELRGARVLDVGCGTGWFSQRARHAGASVVSTDIAVSMLRETRKKCETHRVVADACNLAFSTGSFDVVIASECIEHTLDPFRAVQEMHRVLRPGGSLIVTVPNRVWRFSATIAERLKLRPYEGLENWVGWGDLRRHLDALSMRITAMRGFHLFPPVLRVTWSFLGWADRAGTTMPLGALMLNIAVRACKA